MAYAAYSDQPVIHAEVSIRVAYLRKVAALTMGGLTLSGITSVLTAALIAMVPILSNQIVSLVVIFGSYGLAHYGARSIVFNSSSSGAKLGGFLMGSAAQGVAMGYLILMAALMSLQEFGNPFMLVFQAIGLVGLTTLGMFAYLMTGPRNLSMIGGALSMMFLPMMALMVLSFVFPIGGPIGILLSLVFVGVSAAGLLYQLNQVMHQLPAQMSIEGAYMITMGLLVLFWNVLVLLMRSRR